MNATITYTADGLALHPDALRAVRIFASEDDTRQMLHCVFLDEEGHLTATNGHALIRLMSIDPGGQVPSDRRACWPLAVVDATIDSAKGIRGHKRAAARVTLRWDATADISAPPTVRLIASHLEQKADNKPWSIAARYSRLLGETAEILLGNEGSMIKGPVLVHTGNEYSGKLFEIPWHSDEPEPSAGTWMHGRGTGSPTGPKAEEPRCSAEILIMPVRV